MSHIHPYIQVDIKYTITNPKCNFRYQNLLTKKKIHTQKGRCYISGVPFSFNRYDPNYWSLERLDNSQHHMVDNTVLVCRIMNGRTQLTKEIIQHIYNKYSSNDL